MRVAQPSRRLVDERRDRLALGGQALRGADGRVPGRGRRSRPTGPRQPPRRCRPPSPRGRRPSPPRPAPPRAPAARARWPAAACSPPAARPAAGPPPGSSRKPRWLGLGDQPGGQLARLRAPGSEAPRRRRPRPPRRAPWAPSPSEAALARHQHHGQVGRQGAERGDHRLRLLGRPPLDAVGQQVAARGHQRHRGDRGDQRLGVGRPVAGRRARSSPAPRDRPRARPARAAATAPRRSCPRRCRRSGRRA